MENRTDLRQPEENGTSAEKQQMAGGQTAVRVVPVESMDEMIRLLACSMKT